MQSIPKLSDLMIKKNRTLSALLVENTSTNTHNASKIQRVKDWEDISIIWPNHLYYVPNIACTVLQSITMYHSTSASDHAQCHWHVHFKICFLQTQHKIEMWIDSMRHSTTFNIKVKIYCPPEESTLSGLLICHFLAVEPKIVKKLGGSIGEKKFKANKPFCTFNNIFT